METAMQELRNKVVRWINHGGSDDLFFVIIAIDKHGIEKEKEQIKDAFADGQETPLNHPITPMYSNEEYYNDNYNQK